MFMDMEHNLCSHHQRLRTAVRMYDPVELLHLFGFELNRVCGLGTTHHLHLPCPVYALRLSLSNSERFYDCLYLGYTLSEGGQGSCKRFKRPIQQSLSVKQYNWLRPVASRSHKWPV